MARRSRHGLFARINTQYTYLIILTLIAILLLAGGQFYRNIYDNIRGGVMFVTSPIIKIVNAPFTFIGQMSQNVGNYQALQQKHEDLQFKLRQTSYWEGYARKLLAENYALRQRWQLAEDFPKLPGNFLVARVIADLSGTFIDSFLINVGSNNNITVNDIALDNGALIGRIIDVKSNYSRILLLTDINSRIPVVVGPERLRAIMAGNNSKTPDLLFAPIDSIIQPDMEVVTSGHGGVFPPGIPIGRISYSAPNDIRIEPVAVPEKLEYVDILGFSAKLVPNENKLSIEEYYQERN